jgi:hypothetical protein
MEDYAMSVRAVRSGSFATVIGIDRTVIKWAQMRKYRSSIFETPLQLKYS